MSSRLLVLLGVLGLTGLALRLVAGHHPWDGPVLLELTTTHGVNLGDLPVAAVWLAGMGTFAWLWRRD